ncbi:MAG: ROK family protein [Brevinema sp.]
MRIVAGIEGGGTKFICGIGNEQGEILDSIRIDTTTPDQTMKEVIQYLKTKSFDAIGIGVFGPVELDINEANYGQILNTPKREWQFFNLHQALKKEFDCPIIIEHDVNAALLGELTWGAAQKLRNTVYYTVGTGVGLGLWLDNRFYHGELHSEAGHMMIPILPEDTKQKGSCPFHNNCLEGLVSGSGIYSRFGKKGEQIPEDSPIWDNVAYYLATACVNTMYCYAPQRIILGGGVMNVASVLPKIRTYYLQILNGYDQKALFVNMEEFIVGAALKNDPGLRGAFALALNH